MDKVLARLKTEPALAWKLVVGVLGKDPNSDEAQKAARITRHSPLVSALLAGRDTSGHVYRKWHGTHWTLSLLADLGCPPGDETLRPLLDQTLACWLGEEHKKHIRTIEGRTRRCCSQEGNALYSAQRLGFADDRADELAARLMRWQWPDGGWNCDKRPEAKKSSFMETLIPLRSLALYARTSGDPQVKTAVERAAEIFLKRKLFRRLKDGTIMDRHFVLLSYPSYWHYNILFGLKVMEEAGFLADPRSQEALDLLESKCLPDGGFPAEETYARTTRPELSNYSPVSWGGRSTKKMNLFVTADALTVLRLAGRWSP